MRGTYPSMAVRARKEVSGVMAWSVVSEGPTVSLPQPPFFESYRAAETTPDPSILRPLDPSTLRPLSRPCTFRDSVASGRHEPGAATSTSGLSHASDIGPVGRGRD